MKKNIRIILFAVLIINPLFISAQEIDLESDSLSYISLTRMSLEELMNISIVSSTKAKTKLIHAPSSVTVITWADIRRYGWRNLAEVLSAQTGFFVFSDRIYNFISPRGIYQSNDPNSRILILVDGHSVVESFGYYNGHLASIDLDFVDRIEIIRGPNSVTYGTNAMFSVINLISKKGKAVDGVKAILELGSFDNTKISVGAGTNISDDLDLFFQGGYQISDRQKIYFDEYNDPEYPSDGYSLEKANEKELYKLYFKASYKNNLNLIAFYNNRRKNVPTGIYGGKFNEAGTFFKDENVFAEINYNFTPFINTGTKFRVMLDWYKFNGRFKYYKGINNRIGPSYESEYNKIQSSTIGAEILSTTTWDKKHKTVYGVEFKKYNNILFDYHSENDPDKTLNEYYDIDPEENILSLYMVHTYSPIDKLYLDLGFHFNSYKSIGNHLSIRSALNYNFAKNHWLKLLYGEAFRSPNSWELNGGFYLTGNKELKSEIVRTVEIILDVLVNQNLSFKTSVYYYSLNDNIKAANGQKFMNIEGFYGKGIESEVNFKIQNYIGYLNISYSSVKNKKDDVRIEFTPEWMAKLGFSKELYFGGLTVALESICVGPRIKGDRSQGELPMYNITNMTLSNISISDWIKFTVKVNNIFNTKYEHPSFIGDLASFNMNSQFPVYDIPADGRTFYIKTYFSF